MKLSDKLKQLEREIVDYDLTYREEIEDAFTRCISDAESLEAQLTGDGYWKGRCEAAEKVIMFLVGDKKATLLSLIRNHYEFSDWQQLVNTPLPTEVKAV